MHTPSNRRGFDPLAHALRVPEVHRGCHATVRLSGSGHRRARRYRAADHSPCGLANHPAPQTTPSHPPADNEGTGRSADTPGRGAVPAMNTRSRPGRRDSKKPPQPTTADREECALTLSRHIHDHLSFLPCWASSSPFASLSPVMLVLTSTSNTSCPTAHSVSCRSSTACLTAI